MHAYPNRCRRHRWSLRVLLPIFVLLAVAPLAHADWFSFQGETMTTRLDLEFWGEDRARAEQIRDAVWHEFDQVDRIMSRYREDSELSRVNREAAKAPVKVSEGLFRVLRQALRVSELSEGAFDISFGSVGYFYDFRAKRQPSAEELKQGLARIDYRDIVLNERDRTVSFRKPGLVLDLGGIAKGYAVDLGIAALQREGVRHARLSAGGDMRLLGDKRGKPWIVGIRDPRAEEKHAVVLPLSDTAVSTSGDYERFFVDESGNRVHHILSPQTGKPAQGVQSVTILAPDALTSDGLSTAVFVLGVEKGLAMINRLQGVDAIIIDGQRKMHYSVGLMAPGS